MKANSAYTILIIEDDDSLRLTLSKALEMSGYSVRVASNGSEGVSIARECKPVLVACDVHLPGLDGPSVLESLRQDSNLEMTQFIMMTGDGEGTSQRAGMDLGADDYLAKPFTIEAFLRCVKTRLRRSERYRQADQNALSKLRDTISRRLPHEVYTPLTGILGLSEVLMEDVEQTTPAEAREMLADIHQSAERLHHTLRNYFSLLDVLDTQAPGPVGETLTPAKIVLDAAREATTSVVARFKRESDLALDCAEIDLPLSLANFTAIVTELADNACRYSPKGSPVTVRLRREGDVVTLSVSDKGRGMTSDQIAQVSAFRQFDRTRYEQQGLGLGLTLAQHLISRNGGSFRLESEFGVGTTAMARWAILPKTKTVT